MLNAGGKAERWNGGTEVPTGQAPTTKKTRAGSRAPGPVLCAERGLREIATDDLFDLRARVPIVETSDDQLLPRVHEVLLRCEHVNERSRSELVALLVHAKTFLGGANA